MSIDVQENHNVIINFDGDVEKFRENRIANGFGQSELAEALGLYDATVISHLENGRFNLDSRVYTLFCLLMETHPTYILKQKRKNFGLMLIEPPTSGKQIRDLRISVRPMTQMKMAKLLNLTGKAIISKYENNVKKPSVQTWTMWLLIINKHPHFTIYKRE